MKLSSINKKISIKWKIFGFLALFTAIILILLWLMQTVFLSDIYKTVKLADLKKSADEIVSLLDSNDLQEKADSLSRKNELCILAQTPNGVVIVSSEAMHNCVVHNISHRDRAKLYLDAKQSNSDLLERFVLDQKTGTFRSVQGKEIISEENIILTRCVQNAQGDEVIIFINSVLTPVNSTVKTLNTILIVISILLLLIALVMSFILSSTISRPLKKLTASANELAKGNYDADFSDNSSKEVSSLANMLDFASAELKKNEGLKRELIANISHDLRTPRTLITGYSEVMRDIPNEMTAENLQIIIDESKRLSSLVNDVLDISKLQSNTVEMKFETFDISEVIKETFERYQKLVNQDGYDIQIHQDSPAFVTADRQRILQVLYNLVNNAVTHTGDDKKVIIRQSETVHANKSYVRIEVIDSGDGIAPERLPLIWDRYYKVDKYHKRAQVGSGLGLSIVKSIIELHYGYYGVTSTVGLGSNFWFEIPKA
ncbi:MAG: HAMP domain-containing histidine kinase [Clostridia bacterium]|nr:HAMP domain-containing histidine kinase [Clostridia bacterium]